MRLLSLASRRRSLVSLKSSGGREERRLWERFSSRAPVILPRKGKGGEESGEKGVKSG